MTVSQSCLVLTSWRAAHNYQVHRHGSWFTMYFPIRRTQLSTIFMFRGPCLTRIRGPFSNRFFQWNCTKFVAWQSLKIVMYGLAIFKDKMHSQLSWIEERWYQIQKNMNEENAMSFTAGQLSPRLPFLHPQWSYQRHIKAFPLTRIIPRWMWRWLWTKDGGLWSWEDSGKLTKWRQRMKTQNLSEKTLCFR